MHMHAHTQEHLPRHGDDGDEVSLAMVGHKPDACEAFKLSKRLQDDLAAGLIWGGDTWLNTQTRPQNPHDPCKSACRAGN